MPTTRPHCFALITQLGSMASLPALPFSKRAMVILWTIWSWNSTTPQSEELPGLQIKRPLTISAAESNEDYRGIVASAVATQRDTNFRSGFDAVGFVAENVAVASFQTLGRLIQWAKASPDARHFEERFESGGAAATAERSLKAELAPLIGAASPDDENRFYRHFVALHMNGLSDGGPLRAAVLNHLREATAGEEGQDVLLFGRLCQIAREGAATATEWTRASLLAQLFGTVQLRGIRKFKDDVARVDASSREGLNDVSETVDDFHVPRDTIQNQIEQQLEKHRVVSIGGLPGCGKSAVLKRFASGAAERGPIFSSRPTAFRGPAGQHSRPHWG